jgi:hypothetical protein
MHISCLPIHTTSSIRSLLVICGDESSYEAPYCFNLTVISSPDSKILLSTLLSNTLNLYYSFKVRDQVSHPCKTIWNPLYYLHNFYTKQKTRSVNTTVPRTSVFEQVLTRIWRQILLLQRMPSSGMWRRIDHVWTDLSEERIASIFKIGKPQARNQREQVAAPKRRFTQDLHGATSQKTAFFIVTAVKTSNLTCITTFNSFRQNYLCVKSTLIEQCGSYWIVFFHCFEKHISR